MLIYELNGAEALGSYLQIVPTSDDAPELSKCSIQWYRLPCEGGRSELISGKWAYYTYRLKPCSSWQGTIFPRLKNHTFFPVCLHMQSLLFFTLIH